MAKHDLADNTSSTLDGRRGNLDSSDAQGSGLIDTLSERAGDVVDGAGSIARALPEQVDRAASSAGRVVADAQRTLETGSDDALVVGASMTAGLAIGLLVGRAPRPLVAVVLLPAALMAVTLAQRRGSGLRLDGDRPLVN
jgi:hypothetical protein